MFFVLAAAAQDPSRPFFTPLAGVGVSGQLYAEAGIVHRYNFGTAMRMDCYDCPPIYPFHGCTSISAEIYFGKNQLVAPKLGLWAWWEWNERESRAILEMDGLYAFDLKTGNSIPVVRPAIGAQLSSKKTYNSSARAPWREVLQIKIEIGYNFIYYDPEILSPWQASLVIYQSESRKPQHRFSR